MPAEQSLTVSGLCADLRVARSTVMRWIAAGLPHTTIPSPRGGKERIIFQRDAVLSWVSSNGSITGKRIARAIESAPDSHESPPETTPLIKQLGLLGAVERVKMQEYQTAVLLSQLKHEGKDINAIVAIQDKHMKEASKLASLESQALNFRIRAGELVVAADIQAKFERISTGVKNAVLGVSTSVIPLIMPFLRTEKDAHAVREIIDKACRDSLRLITDRKQQSN